jgi:hypothetical protein
MVHRLLFGEGLKQSVFSTLTSFLTLSVLITVKATGPSKNHPPPEESPPQTAHPEQGTHGISEAEELRNKDRPLLLKLQRVNYHRVHVTRTNPNTTTCLPAGERKVFGSRLIWTPAQ